MRNLFLSVVYAVLFMSLSGFVDLAQAAIKCADRIGSSGNISYSNALTQFTYHNGITYAIALSSVTGATSLPDAYFAFDAGVTRDYFYDGTDTNSLKLHLAAGRYGAARPVSIPDVATKQWLLGKFGSLIPGGTYIDAWKGFGTGLPFTKIDGSNLPYAEWITPPDLAQNPSGVVMQQDGHFVTATSGVKAQQLVEFDGKLDCAIDTDIIIPPDTGGGETPPTGQGPGATENANDPYAIKDVICGQDLNLNDFVGDSGEMLNCLNSTQGQLCPVGVLDCSTNFQPPICPSGSVLNTTRDMCQKAPAQVKCAAGYTWDQSIDKCVMYPPCSEGGTYNSITNRCEKIVQNDCPVNYTFDNALQVCQKAVVCPNGAFNPARDRCESPVVWDCPVGYAYNSGIAKCEAAPSCSSGWTYNTTTDRCQVTPNNCPSGYLYNPALDRCVVSATCGSGGVLNGSSDKCELTAAITCNTAAGWAFNSGSGKCEQNPTCASPGSYNTAYNLCMASSTGTACPGGYYYSAAQSACVAAPICNSGTFSNGNDRCEANPSYSCPDPSYTYIAGRGRCEKAPVCPGGMSYNSTYNVCAQAITQMCGAGYGWVAARNRCEKVPECATGTYNYSTNKCESPSSYGANLAYSCPSGGTLNGTTCTIAGGSYPAVFTCAAPFLPAAGGPPYYCYRMYNAANCAALGDTIVYGFPGNYLCMDLNLNPGSCPSGGTLSGSTCTTSSSYSATPTYSCPSGGSLSGSTCYVTNQSNPTCTGGSFDPSYDVCWVTIITSCAQGSYDGSSGLCILTPTCSNGALDGGTDTCYQAKSTGCPGGYILSGGVCIASPSCATPGYFYGGVTDLCKTPATYLCPSGYLYSVGTGQCYQYANCNGGGLNTASDRCEMAFAYTCPGGYATIGSLCQAAPGCSAGGSYSTSLNLCDSSTSVCSAGTLDTSLDVCYQAAGCAGGALNPNRDKCEATAAPNCGSQSFDATNIICYSPLFCALGAFQAPRDRCEATVTRNCASYTWSAPAAKCLQPVTCPTDASFSLKASIQFSSVLDRCLSSSEHICSASLAWNGLPVMKCEAMPICAGAIYYDPDTNSCLMSTGCPYGNQYACMQNPHLSDASGKGGWQCSTNSCVNTGPGGAASIDDIQDDAYLQDDGPREDGKCIGQIYIFNGKASRCRPTGWTVGYINDCCADGKVMTEDTGGAGTVTGLAFKSLAVLYESSKAAYYGYEGFQAVSSGLTQGTVGAATPAAMEAVNAGANVAVQGGNAGQAAAAGISNSSAVSGAAKGAAGAAVVWAAGAISDAAGGDQDSKMVAQMLAAYIAMQVGLMSGPQAIIGVIIIVVMRLLMGTGCDQNDITTVNFEASKRCHFVGNYCEKRWAMVGCVQKAKGYCCFNSVMARIIHEQGRPQINFEWGTPANPVCRGFKPEEFQSLDFAKIDLGEYFEIVQKDMETKIGDMQQGITDKMTERFQQITGGATAHP